MRVLLLAPYPEKMKNVSTTQYPPLGILYIGGAIRDLVTDLMILDANVLKLSKDETINRVIDFQPDIIGISVNIVTAEVARDLANEIKNIIPEVLLIAGGPLPTAAPKEWLLTFDLVIRGEGEETFRYIVLNWEKNKNKDLIFPGLCIRDGNVTMAVHPDLDKLPFPAYDYLVPSLPFYSKKARIVKKNMASILTSRGCPYGCIFCDKSVHGTNFRPRSVTSVLNEIKWLYDKYHVRQLDILDDNFTFDIERAMKILDGLMKIGKFAINCQNGVRADRLTKELVKKMKQAGVFRAGIGIESGKPEVIKKLNKHLELSNVAKAIAMFREQRITVHGYFILGFPFETREDILDTIRFAVQVNPHYANFSHFIPIIGTPIYNQLVNENKLIRTNGEISDGFYRLDAQIKNNPVNSDEMKKLYTKAWRRFYLRPRKVADILSSVKSFYELIWIINIGKDMFKNHLLKK